MNTDPDEPEVSGFESSPSRKSLRSGVIAWIVLLVLAGLVAVVMRWMH